MSSGYKLVSKGVVVKDKDRYTDEIDVSPIEELYDQQSGLIKDNVRLMTGSSSSTRAGTQSTMHEAKNYIRAKWKRGAGSNRITAPDVFQNEMVDLYRFGDTEAYYWEDSGREPLNRGREDVTEAYSNRDGGARDQPFDLESSYFRRVNTKDGFIHIHTSTTNGEPCTFDFMLNAKDGKWSVVDGKGNYINMDAVNGNLHAFTNKSIVLESELIHFKSKDHVVESKTFKRTTSGQSETNTPLHKYSQHVDILGNLKIGGGIQVTGGGLGGGESSCVITGKTTFKGDAHVTQNFQVDGKATGHFPGPKI